MATVPHCSLLSPPWTNCGVSLGDLITHLLTILEDDPCDERVSGAAAAAAAAEVLSITLSITTQLNGTLFNIASSTIGACCTETVKPRNLERDFPWG